MNRSTNQTPWDLFRIISGSSTVILLVSVGLIYRSNLTTFFSGSPWIFILMVILSEVLFIPRIVMLLASGIFFNPITGAMLTITGDLIAALVVFYLGSLSFAPVVTHRLQKLKSFEKLSHFIRGKNTIFTVALLRIAPFSHYSVVSLLSGAANIPIGFYISGTLAGLIPTAFLYPLMAQNAMKMRLWSTAGFVVILMVVIVTAMALLKWNNRNEKNSKT